MIWIFIAFMFAYGLTAILFAFVEPPAALSSFYRVPAIFVFLPDKWIVPAGRIFVGIASLVTTGIVVKAVLFS